jgi:hypothetical protein
MPRYRVELYQSDYDSYIIDAPDEDAAEDEALSHAVGSWEVEHVYKLSEGDPEYDYVDFVVSAEDGE